MKVSASMISLLIAMGVSITTSPAAKTYQDVPTRHHAKEICDKSDASQLYDWSRGIQHNPCWPCVSGEGSTTSAYPSWEVCGKPK